MKLLKILNKHYPICFDKYEQLRDGGSTSYVVFSSGDKYFLRVVKPAFFDTYAVSCAKSSLMGALAWVHWPGCVRLIGSELKCRLFCRERVHEHPTSAALSKHRNGFSFRADGHVRTSYDTPKSR